MPPCEEIIEAKIIVKLAENIGNALIVLPCLSQCLDTHISKISLLSSINIWLGKLFGGEQWLHLEAVTLKAELDLFRQLLAALVVLIVLTLRLP